MRRSMTRSLAAVFMLAGVLAQAQANPVSVTVGGTVYRLTTSTSRISYSSDPALFQSQPWWGNASLAGEISSAVQYSLGGYINNAATSGPSAFVGYDLNGSAVSLSYWNGSRAVGCSSCVGQNSTYWWIFLSPPTGPTAVDTLDSMKANAIGLRNIFALQASNVNPGLSQDCAVFDARGICVAFTGKQSDASGSGGRATSGAVTLAYQMNSALRVGAYVEQRLGSVSAPGIRIDNNSPDIGVFGVWSAKPGADGLEVRAAYRYGSKGISLTRQVVGSSEAGSGSGDLTTQGAQLTLSRGYSLGNIWRAEPYAGLRHIDIERSGYSEASNIASPLTYAKLQQKSTQILLGARFAGQISGKLTLTGALGVEHDLSHRISDYTATGVTDLSTFAFNSNIQKTRPVASVGLTYGLSDVRQINAQVVYREEAFNASSTTSMMVTYSAGF